MLYPLKFTPLLKEKIWGGNYLYNTLHKGSNPHAKIGESWEISSLPGDVSVVAEGFLKDNTLNELVEVYMGDLVGDKVYEKFGLEFPLLIKFIDAQSDLSVQVHPDEKLAIEKYQSHGKTEFWYIIDCEEGAKIVAGFDKKSSPIALKEAIENNTFSQLLRYDDVSIGDAFYVPAGQIHTIGKGNVIVEIQQSSDLTFRVYDFDRRDTDGNPRELHIEESLNSINYNAKDNYKIPYKSETNKPSNLVESEYFTSNYFSFNQKVGRDYYFLESFVVLICTQGEFTIEYEEGESVTMKKGETVLLPAAIRQFYFTPKGNQATFLETYIDF